MRNLVIAGLLSLSLCAWGSTSYLRPTIDSGPLAGVYGCDTSTRDVTSPLGQQFSASYIRKSGIGPIGASATGTVSYSDIGGRTWDQDVFGYSNTGNSYGNWQTPPSGTFTSATLNISISSANTGSGTPSYCVAYTTNSGSTWTVILGISSSQSTLTVSGITSISGLGLMIGCQTSSSSNSACSLTVYDVWLTWNYTPSPTGYVQYGYPLEIGCLILFDERLRRGMKGDK